MVIFSYKLSIFLHRPEEVSAIPLGLTLHGDDGGDHDGGDVTLPFSHESQSMTLHLPTASIIQDFTHSTLQWLV